MLEPVPECASQPVIRNPSGTTCHLRARLGSLLRAAGLLAAFAPMALAQPEVVTPAQTPSEAAEPEMMTTPEAIPAAMQDRPARTVETSLRIRSRFYDTEDFDNGGNVDVRRYNADLNVGVPLGQMSTLSLGFGVEHATYDFNNVFLFPDTGDPVSQVTTYSANAGLIAPFTESRYALILRGGLNFSAETDASYDDALTWNAFGGVSYSLSRQLSFGGGIIVATRLEDDPLIIPVPFFRYAVDERWLIASEGPSLILQYKANDELTFGGSVGFENSSYRLGTSAGISSRGVLNETRVPVRIFADWTPTPAIEIRGEVFSSLYTEYEALADNETEISSDETDAALGLGLSITFKF